MKPRIFIGSSTEGLAVAERIKNFFEPIYECKIWNDGIFQYNDNFLDTLMKSASLFDFAFMVFSADDLVLVRDKILRMQEIMSCLNMVYSWVESEIKGHLL